MGVQIGLRIGVGRGGDDKGLQGSDGADGRGEWEAPKRGKFEQKRELERGVRK